MSTLKTAKEWIKQFGDDSVRVGEGLSDQIMSQSEFENAVQKEMGELPKNIYRNEGIFAGEDSERTKRAIADLKKVRKELVNKTPEEKQELLEKAVELKQKPAKKTTKKKVDKPKKTE